MAIFQLLMIAFCVIGLANSILDHSLLGITIFVVLGATVTSTMKINPG